MKVKSLRRLILESIGFEGVFKAVKDYLQPILKNMALLIPLFFVMEETRRSAILVGAVYFVLHLASAYASRNSYKITEFTGGEENGARFLWKLAFVIYLILTPLLFINCYPLVIVTFIGLYLIQNFWRPILISRFDAFATETQGATVLSIESQAKTTSTMLIAPILGMAVDLVKANGLGGEFWPVGATGAIVAIFILCTCYT